MKVFLGCKGHIWAEIIEKSNKNYQVWSHESSTFFKKMPHFGQNPRPGESDPYVVQVTNLHGTLQHSFDIDFRPILVRDIYPNEARVMVGGKLRLEAEISGGRITWYKDGEEVKRWKSTGEPRKPGDPTAHVRDDEISSLTIWECTMEDAGSYMGKTETGWLVLHLLLSSYS